MNIPTLMLFDELWQYEKMVGKMVGVGLGGRVIVMYIIMRARNEVVCVLLVFLLPFSFRPMHTVYKPDTY